MLSVRTTGRCAWYSLAVALLTTLHAAAAHQADGPYVMGGGDGRWEAWSVEATPDGVRKSVESLSAGAKITVPAVGNLPAFDVKLRQPAERASDVVITQEKVLLFVVADTHGEYEIVAELLQKHRIVDASLRWSFGRGHLVILGDVFDRGPNQIEILWLLYELEEQAARAGGDVHLVLGNHEAMVFTGDLRYLNPKYVRTAQVLGAGSYSELVGVGTVLGQWLRTKPVVLKIGDLLCLHGGISRSVVEQNFRLPYINQIVRNVLNEAPIGGEDHAHAKFLTGPLGPLWYRGYFADQKGFVTATSQDIDAIAKHFGVRAILVGHTTVPTVTSLYDGRVIAVQVYPHRDATTGQPIMEALRVEDGRFLRAKIDGTLEPIDVKFTATPEVGISPPSPTPVPHRPD